MNLVLYDYWRSSSAWRVRFALHHKGLTYQRRFVNLRASEQLSDEHKTLSPLGVVPCLLVNGRPLCESVAILEYLEDVVPEKALLPHDPWRRARVRQLVELVNSGIQPLQNLVVLDHLSSDEGIRQSWVRHFNQRGLVALESALAGVEAEFGSGPYSFGDQLTLADVYLVPQVATAIRFQVPMDPYPRVRAVFEACMKLDSAIASSPQNQPDAPKKP
jgi:maleylacetoacetate isomerase/maleylpyruvate isomerase